MFGVLGESGQFLRGVLLEHPRAAAAAHAWVAGGRTRKRDRGPSSVSLSGMAALHERLMLREKGGAA